MNRRYLPVWVVLAAALILWTGRMVAQETKVKNNKLSFSLPDLNGKTVSSSDEKFKGKVVLVDIWGTWCPPCREEIPELVKMYKKYKEKGLEVVGIAFESPKTKEKQIAGLKEFVEKNAVNYTILLGGSQGETEKVLPDLQDFRGYPTGIFIGKDGKVDSVEIGYNSADAGEMEKMIVRLLGK